MYFLFFLVIFRIVLNEMLGYEYCSHWSPAPVPHIIWVCAEPSYSWSSFVCSPCRNHCDIFDLNFSCFNALKTKLNQVEREVLTEATYQYQRSHLPRINLWIWGLSFFLSDIENAEYIEINKCSSWVHQSQALVNSTDFCWFFFFCKFEIRSVVMSIILDF